MPPSPNGRPVRTDLRAIYTDGALYGIMVGAGETYFAAFVLAMGMGEVAAGMIVSLPMLAGAILQLISPWAVEQLGSHRRWVVATAAIQALMFLPLAIGAAIGVMPAWLVFAVVSVYWAMGLAAGATWNTWISLIVPARVRASYFAKRNRAVHLTILTGLAGGAFILETGRELGDPLTAFTIIFAAACVFRLASSRCLASQSEPHASTHGHRSLSITELATHFFKPGGGRLLTFMLTVQFTAWIASPFFAPYMLGELQWSYEYFLLSIGALWTAKAAASPIMGRLINRFGPMRVLCVSTALVAVLPALWLASDSIGWIMLLQAGSGVGWAGFELATFLILLKRIDQVDRTSVMTAYNLGSAIAMVSGSLIGAAIFASLGDDHEVYMLVFALSCIARLIALNLLRWAGREPSVRHQQPTSITMNLVLPAETAPSQSQQRELLAHALDA